MVRTLLQQVVTPDELPLGLTPTYILPRNMKISDRHSLCKKIFSTPMAVLADFTSSILLESAGTIWSTLVGFEPIWGDLH